MAKRRIGELLVAAGVLTETGLRRALREQNRWGAPLGRILVELRIVNEPDMIAVLSEQLRVPVVDLDVQVIEDDVLALVPGLTAKEKQMIPFNVDGSFLDLAMCDPTDLGAMDELRIRTHLNVRPYLAGPRAMARAIQQWYGIVDPDAIPYDPDSLFSSDRVIDPVSASARPVGDDSAERARAHAVAETAAMPGPAIETQRVKSLEKAVAVLQERQSRTERLLSRDQAVLRNLLYMLIQKNIATREEILEWINQ